MFFVLGIACFLVGWKLVSTTHEIAFAVANVEFSIYHGLYVLGALCLVRAFYKWMHD